MRGKAFLALAVFFALVAGASRLELPERALPPVEIQPDPGRYDHPVKISFSSEPEATVYFSLGPGEAIPYLSPVHLRHSATVRFFARDRFGNRSPTGEALYEISLDVDPPQTAASPPGGKFTHPISVRLLTDPDARVFYTLDGTEPTQESKVYSGPLPLRETTSVRFFGMDEAGNQEEIRKETYRISIDPSKPATLAEPSRGLFNSSVKVSLSAGEDSTIHYTVDGTRPSKKSPTYSGPVEFVRSGVLRFFAVDAKGSQENPREESYVIDLEPPLVTADPPGGRFPDAVTVTLQSSEPGRIYCDPSPGTEVEGSRLYRKPFVLSETTVISFFAVDRARNKGLVETREFIIDRVPPEVRLRPPEGDYPGKIRVMIETSEPADVFYTLDGTTPDESSPPYEGPIDIEENTTLSWLAIDKAGNKGAPGRGRYVLDRTPPVTKAQPPSGKFLGPITVSLLTEEGAVTRYTLDGTSPSETSPVYTGPILLEKNTDLKFFSTDSSGNKEEIRTETYQIPEGTPLEGK